MTTALPALHSARKSTIAPGAGLLVSVVDPSDASKRAFDEVDADAAFKAASDLPAISAAGGLAGTDLVVFTRPGTGIDYNGPLSGLLAWLLANDGSQDPAAATVVGSLPSGGTVLGYDGSGALIKIPVSLLLGTSSGGGTSSTAPSQVGNLAAGTPTSSSIPVTYTAATGTAPISYAGQTSPHGANTWTNNGGTFGATGGTFTGLTASTSYDLRIIATNAAGSSTTTLTSGVSAAASGGGGGGSYPAISLNSPTFGTAKFGQGLKTGSGAAALSLVDNSSGGADAVVSGWVNFGTSAPSTYTELLGLTVGSQQFGWLSNAGTLDVMNGGGSGGGSNSHTFANVYDGQDHYLRMVISTVSGASSVTYYLDGANKYSGSCAAVAPGAATLIVDTGAINGGYIDDVEVLNSGAGLNNSTLPSTAASRTSTTNVIYALNGNGTGS